MCRMCKVILVYSNFVGRCDKFVTLFKSDNYITFHHITYQTTMN